jgi:hypothetical protein
MSRPRLLLLMFVSLGLALTYAWVETPRQQRVKNVQQAPAGGSSVSATRKSPTGRSEIGLDFSDGEKIPYQKPTRDLFRPLYAQSPPVQQPLVVVPQLTPAPVRIIQPPPATSRPVDLPKNGAKPIPPLKILGYLQKDAKQMAFLSSRQGEIYVVKQGDRFADNLLIRELNADRIVISRNLNDEGVTLLFGKENARLKSAGPLATDRPSFNPIELPEVEISNPQLPMTQEQPINRNGEKTVDP